MLINGPSNTAATIAQLMQIQQNLEPESPEALRVQQRIEMLQGSQQQQSSPLAMPPQALMLISAVASLISAVAQLFGAQQPQPAQASDNTQALLSIYQNLEPESPEALAIASRLGSLAG